MKRFSPLKEHLEVALRRTMQAAVIGGLVLAAAVPIDSQASRAAESIAYGACRIRRRGCPRTWEYVVGPPQYCSRKSCSRSAAGPRSSSGYIARNCGSAATPA